MWCYITIKNSEINVSPGNYYLLIFVPTEHVQAIISDYSMDNIHVNYKILNG